MPKYSRIVRLGSAHNLHARPARMLANAAAASGRPVTIAVDDQAPVDAEDIMSVMSLNLAKDDDLTISVIAENRDTAIDVLGKVATIITLSRITCPTSAPTSFPALTAPVENLSC